MHRPARRPIPHTGRHGRSPHHWILVQPCPSGVVRPRLEARSMDLTRMLIGGDWRPAERTGRTEDVRSPYDGSVVGTVPVAGPDDVEAALAAAEAGAARWRRTPAHERTRILLRAAQLADERAAEVARTISAEVGKTITEATGEASRSGEIIRLAAFEAASS